MTSIASILAFASFMFSGYILNSTALPCSVISAFAGLKSLKQGTVLMLAQRVLRLKISQTRMCVNQSFASFRGSARRRFNIFIERSSGVLGVHAPALRLDVVRSITPWLFYRNGQIQAKQNGTILLLEERQQTFLQAFLRINFLVDGPNRYVNVALQATGIDGLPYEIFLCELRQLNVFENHCHFSSSKVTYISVREAV